MFGVLVVTHGRLAAELLGAAEMVIGGLGPRFEALSLDWKDGYEEARAKIGEALRRLDSGDGVLVLTDMFGDTPSNAAASHATPGRVEVISGVNLPMVVRLGCSDVAAMDLASAVVWLEEKGRRSIGRAASGRPEDRGGCR